jgi:hypothetical protein
MWSPHVIPSLQPFFLLPLPPFSLFLRAAGHAATRLRATGSPISLSLPLRRLRGELERRRSRPLHLGMSALPPPTTETDSGQRRTHARFLAIKGAGKTSSPRTSRFTKPNPSSSDHRACQPESKTANSRHQRSDPSTSTVVASASMEMEQLTARFNDAVAVHGNN